MMSQCGESSNCEQFRSPEFDPVRAGLAGLEQAVWQELVAACHDVQHGWRLPVLGTVMDSVPQQRIVVLRRVVPSENRFFIHTDLRSPKVLQLQQNNRSSWLFYDATSRIQLVLQGTSELHFDDSLADEQWGASSDFSRQAYLAAEAPGTAISAGEPRVTLNIPETPPAEELEAGRKHFIVIECIPGSMDLLFIRRSGNLRAHFRKYESEWTGAWLQP